MPVCSLVPDFFSRGREGRGEGGDELEVFSYGVCQGTGLLGDCEAENLPLLVQDGEITCIWHSL